MLTCTHTHTHTPKCGPLFDGPIEREGGLERDHEEVPRGKEHGNDKKCQRECISKTRREFPARLCWAGFITNVAF